MNIICAVAVLVAEMGLLGSAVICYHPGCASYSLRLSTAPLYLLRNTQHAMWCKHIQMRI